MDKPAERCFIIAEIGVNHNGSLELAKKLIDAAAEAGADAVKFQTFLANDLVTPDAAKAEYQAKNTGNSGSQYQMLKDLELTEAEFAELATYCKVSGIQFLSTPFSETAADLLERIGVEAYKVSSGDLTHLPLLAHLARKGRPIILSTGMGNLSEVENAVHVISENGNPDLSLLHCVSSYPAPAEDCNLAAMRTMSLAFGLPVGWSDHSVGCEMSFAAVALGASIIEKHITLDRDLPGPDHLASMEPDEFLSFTRGIRAIEKGIGNGIKRPTAAERETAKVARRSLVVVQDLSRGHVVTAEDLRIMRPGTGMAPALRELVVGLALAKDVVAFTPLTPSDFND